MNLLNLENSFMKLLWECYGPLFPTSKEKREEFLDKVRQKVDYYKPRIEEKCKMSLGEVKVKDNKHWLSDVAYGSAYRNAVENAWKQGRIPTKMDFHESFMVASVAEAIMFAPILLYNTMCGADFREYNRTIYVPFYYMNRFMDVDFERRAKTLDYGVVHELAHVLWEEISRDTIDHSMADRKWIEGFATYCADDYFADLYHAKIEKISRLPRVYIDGKKKVEELVARHGKEIVLEIPKRWKEFEGDKR